MLSMCASGSHISSNTARGRIIPTNSGNIPFGTNQVRTTFSRDWPFSHIYLLSVVVIESTISEANPCSANSASKTLYMWQWYINFENQCLMLLQHCLRNKVIHIIRLYPYYQLLFFNEIACLPLALHKKGKMLSCPPSEERNERTVVIFLQIFSFSLW